MTLLRWVSACCVTAIAVFGQSELPALRVEANDAGSALIVKNRAAQPVTAFLIELVDYPGSSFVHLEEDLGGAIAPGAEKRIQVSNMLPGAVPDYVKLQAAIFADGATAGVAERVMRLIERRRAALRTTRELIARLEKGATAAELRQWAESKQTGRGIDGIVTGVERQAIEAAARRMERAPAGDVLEGLRRSERSLAASKPAL